MKEDIKSICELLVSIIGVLYVQIEQNDPDLNCGRICNKVILRCNALVCFIDKDVTNKETIRLSNVKPTKDPSSDTKAKTFGAVVLNHLNNKFTSCVHLGNENFGRFSVKKNDKIEKNHFSFFYDYNDIERPENTEIEIYIYEEELNVDNEPVKNGIWSKKSRILMFLQPTTDFNYTLKIYIPRYSSLSYDIEFVEDGSNDISGDINQWRTNKLDVLKILIANLKGVSDSTALSSNQMNFLENVSNEELEFFIELIEGKIKNRSREFDELIEHSSYKSGSIVKNKNILLRLKDLFNSIFLSNNELSDAKKGTKDNIQAKDSTVFHEIFHQKTAEFIESCVDENTPLFFNRKKSSPKTSIVDSQNRKRETKVSISSVHNSIRRTDDLFNLTKSNHEVKVSKNPSELQHEIILYNQDPLVLSEKILFYNNNRFESPICNHLNNMDIEINYFNKNNSSNFCYSIFERSQVFCFMNDKISIVEKKRKVEIFNYNGEVLINVFESFEKKEEDESTF